LVNSAHRPSPAASEHFAQQCAQKQKRRMPAITETSELAAEVRELAPKPLDIPDPVLATPQPGFSFKLKYLWRWPWMLAEAVRRPMAGSQGQPKPVAACSPSNTIGTTDTATATARAEQAEAENARLRAELAAANARAKADLAKASAELALAASRAERASLKRSNSIRTIVLNRAQLDLAFLVDATSSMKPHLGLVSVGVDVGLSRT
jgi:hypothetical protein